MGYDCLFGVKERLRKQGEKLEEDGKVIYIGEIGRQGQSQKE